MFISPASIRHTAPAHPRSTRARPWVDLSKVTVDDKGIYFPPGSVKGGKIVWVTDPRTGKKIGGRPMLDGSVRIPFDGFRPRAGYTMWVAGDGGWTKVPFASGGTPGKTQPLSQLGGKVLPAPPEVDGSRVILTQDGVQCQPPAVIGYDTVKLTVRHPYTGRVETLEVPVSQLDAAFNRLDLNIATGDQVKLEFSGPNGKLQKELVFPKAPNRGAAYHLDELAG